MSKPQTDDHGREIRAGDLLKVFHFTAAPHRRAIFMHKLVFPLRDLRPDAEHGEVLYVVEACEIQSHRVLSKLSRCPLSVISSCEIIDGQDYWWERPREKP